MNVNIPMPITVAARSQAWTVFARSNAGIVGSNPIQSMDVCVRLFCVCVVLRAGSGLATGWSPVQGVLPTVYRITKLKKTAKIQQKDSRAMDRYIRYDESNVIYWFGGEFIE
jgi:hypothetical protein